MALNVKVTTYETIKPSSPTPAHLRSMPLCIVDQLAPDIYVQAILFYHADVGVAPAPKVALLKDSLSKTLSHFYPLAGRLSGDTLRADVHVDCNDEGAAFYEATVEGRLDTLLSKPPMRELCKLMPNGGANIRHRNPLLAVQLNVFSCGGVALGVCIAHQVGDAASLAVFLSCWAEVGRGEEPRSLPRFHAASVLPPANLPQALVPHKVDGLLPKRFVIRAPELNKLKEGAAFARVQPPTRVEAVTALLWRCIVRARPKESQKRTPVALVTVDLRKKMSGELSDVSFGNLVSWATVADDSMKEDSGKEKQGLLERSIRDAVRSVNGESVREQLEGFLSGQNLLEDGTVDTMEFSSWCRFSFYETDFGWGGPAWYCSLMKDLRNLAVLADTKLDDGVEVLLWLSEDEMENFEKDPELMEFVDQTSISF